MTAHKHAHLMVQYAQDALETDKPWERWQYRFFGGIIWLNPSDEITFYSDVEYRRKPQTITIAGIEVPKPVSEPLCEFAVYYYPDLIDPDLHDLDSWNGDSWDMMRLKANIIHLDKESAIIHAKALIKVSGGEV